MRTIAINAAKSCAVIVVGFVLLVLIDHYHDGWSWQVSVVDAGLAMSVFGLAMIIICMVLTFAMVLVAAMSALLDALDPLDQPSWWHPKDRS